MFLNEGRVHYLLKDPGRQQGHLSLNHGANSPHKKHLITRFMIRNIAIIPNFS